MVKIIIRKPKLVKDVDTRITKKMLEDLKIDKSKPIWIVQVK